jgi:hypothetical protein
MSKKGEPIMAQQKTPTNQQSFPKTRTCPGCGGINNIRNMFCTSCAESLAVQCRYCGMEVRVDPDTRYCPACCGDLRKTKGLSYQERQRLAELPLLLEGKKAEMTDTETRLLQLKQKRVVSGIKTLCLCLVVILVVWELCELIPALTGSLMGILGLVAVLWLGRRIIPVAIHALLTRSWRWGYVLSDLYREIAEHENRIASIGTEIAQFKSEQERLTKLNTQFP